MRSPVVFIIMIAFLFPGCGGGSEGSGSFSTGLDTDRVILSMNDSDINQACSKYSKFLEKYFLDPRSCYVDGLSDTRLLGRGEYSQAKCEEIVDECTADSSNNTSLEALSPCELQNLERRRCASTIEQYEACVSERAQKLEKFLSSLSCQNAGDEQKYTFAIEDFFGEEIFSGPKCQEFISTCGI